MAQSERPESQTKGKVTKLLPGTFVKVGEFVNPVRHCLRNDPAHICRGTSIAVSAWKHLANYTCACGFQTTGVPAQVYAAAKKSGLVA